MDKDQLENLKTALSHLKVKQFELNRAKIKKEKETIEAVIQRMTNKMIEDFDLTKYDLYIKMESYKTKFFIFDVEEIIRKVEENLQE